jgi:hypothetical protein
MPGHVGPGITAGFNLQGNGLFGLRLSSLSTVGHGDSECGYQEGVVVKSTGMDTLRSSREQVLNDGARNGNAADKNDKSQSDIGYIEPECFGIRKIKHVMNSLDKAMHWTPSLLQLLFRILMVASFSTFPVI